MPKTIKRPIFGNAADAAGVIDLENARLIDITRLSPNPFQPRAAFDPAALDELAASIREHGILQALSVRETPGALDMYQIIAGERRKLAAEIAGLDAVPCLIQDVDNPTMALLALTENVQREDLTPLELAYSCDRIKGITGLSARAISDQLGKNHNYVDDLLKLIRYPRVAELLRSGKIANPTVAAAIADIDDEELRTSLLDRTARGERLRVRDVQEAHERRKVGPVRDNATGTEPQSTPVAPLRDSPRAEPAAPSPTGRQTATPGEPVSSSDTTNTRPVAKDTPPRPAVPDKLADDGRLLPHESPMLEDQDGQDRRDRLTAPAAIAAPDKLAPVPPMEGSAVHLRDLHIIQLREGRDGESRQLDTAERATVLRILEADLAWLKDIDRRAP